MTSVVALLFCEDQHRVSPIVGTSQYQVSTLEKTKHGHLPTMNNLLRKNFYRIVTNNSSPERSFGRCLFYFYNFSSPGLLESRIIRSTVPLHIIDLDFAVTRSSPESFRDRFAITAKQTVELKWLILKKRNK